MGLFIIYDLKNVNRQLYGKVDIYIYISFRGNNISFDHHEISKT